MPMRVFIGATICIVTPWGLSVALSRHAAIGYCLGLVVASITAIRYYERKL